MKKQLLGAALIMMAGEAALASKARTAALQDSAHITDTSIIFSVIGDIHNLPDFAIFEMGDTALSTATPNASGGFVRTMGDAKMGLFLGTKAAERSDSFLGVENPLGLVYGRKASNLSWAVGLTYASSDKKTSFQKQSYNELHGGVIMGDWQVYLNLGLTDTADGSGAEATKADKYSKTNNNLGVYYTMDTLTFNFDYVMSNKKTEISSAEVKTDVTDMKLAVVNSIKADANDFFYGATYISSSSKVGTVKTETSKLMANIGAEVDAASWLVLRASVTQPVLIGSSKTTGASANTLDHATTVAAGAGLKFNKSLLDMTLSMASTGEVKTDNLGAQASYTYNF